MTLEPELALRLRFLLSVVGKQCRHLSTTDQRLFGNPLTLEKASKLEEDVDMAERVEAFGNRYGRLQDTVNRCLASAKSLELGL